MAAYKGYPYSTDAMLHKFGMWMITNNEKCRCIECDACHFVWKADFVPDYCPNCAAYMKEEDE